MITRTRTEHPAQRALRNIVAEVSAVIPRGLKGDKYWDMTVEAHDACIDAVRACEANDCFETRQAVRQAGEAWKEAWLRAGRAWAADLGRQDRERNAERK
jgi:hypothetical protein